MKTKHIEQLQRARKLIEQVLSEMGNKRVDKETREILSNLEDADHLLSCCLCGPAQEAANTFMDNLTCPPFNDREIAKKCGF